MAEETAVAGLPYMTISVYRVNSETGERTVLRKQQVVEAGEVLMSSEYPPCSCYLCKDKRR
jgi:hypothetical protein